jgi:hypothetical protein
MPVHSRLGSTAGGGSEHVAVFRTSLSGRSHPEFFPMFACAQFSELGLSTLNRYFFLWQHSGFLKGPFGAVQFLEFKHAGDAAVANEKAGIRSRLATVGLEVG